MSSSSFLSSDVLLGRAWLLSLSFFVAAPLAASPDIQVEESYELVIDEAGDGEVRRGDTVEFDLTVTNQGSGNAVAVEIDNALQEYLDLDAASIEISPIAVDDDYSDVPGDAAFEVGTADGLLANDRALFPEGGTPPGLEVEVDSSDSSSAQGGTVSINSDGSFEYTPPTGYEGADSFDYTLINDHGLTDTASVNLEVTAPVLYVSNSNSTGISACDEAPHASIQDAINALDGEDEIRVCAGSGPYEQAQTLEVSDGVVLLGEPAWRGEGDHPMVRAGSAHDGDSPLVQLSDNTHIEGFEFSAIEKDTLYSEDKANILIRGNRFTTDKSDVEHIINIWTTPGSTASGWIAVLDNGFLMDGAVVSEAVHVRAWGESAYEVLFADNHYSGGQIADVFVADSSEEEQTLIAEVRGNEVVEADAHSGASPALFNSRRRSSNGGSTLFFDNHVRVDADSNDMDFFYLVDFFVTGDGEHCLAFEGNDLRLNTDAGFGEDDVNEYLFANDDTDGLFMEGLGDGTFDALEQHIQDQDANGDDVRVITLNSTPPFERPGPENTVRPAPENCARIEGMPAFD